jgi:hypothetical protein
MIKKILILFPFFLLFNNLFAQTYHQIGFGGFCPIGDSQNEMGFGLNIIYKFQITPQNNTKIFVDIGTDIGYSIIEPKVENFNVSSKYNGFSAEDHDWSNWELPATYYGDCAQKSTGRIAIPVGIGYNIAESVADETKFFIGLKTGPVFFLNRYILQHNFEGNLYDVTYNQEWKVSYVVSPTISEIWDDFLNISFSADFHTNGLVLLNLSLTINF